MWMPNTVAPAHWTDQLGSGGTAGRGRSVRTSDPVYRPSGASESPVIRTVWAIKFRQFGPGRAHTRQASLRNGYPIHQDTAELPSEGAIVAQFQELSSPASGDVGCLKVVEGS